MICYFKGHKFEHVANFTELDNFRRGLWQCARCKTLRMELASEFYDKRIIKRPV